MGFERFQPVPPRTTILPLSNGQAITVRTRLNHGEERAAHARAWTIDPKTDKERLDRSLLPDLEVVAYLVDWTITDESGHVIPIRGRSAEEIQAAIDALDSEDVTEIRRAITEHGARMAEARALEKKAHAGSNGAGAISPSPSAVDGPWSTSVS